MICTNCQKKNPESAKFCNFCGVVLSADNSKINQEDTLIENQDPINSGWQIEKDQDLDSRVDMDKQKSVSNKAANLNSSTNSKKEIAPILLKLATITHYLITFGSAFLIISALFFDLIKPGLRMIFSVLITVLWLIFSFLFWKWKKNREGKYSIKDSQSELVGEVRGLSYRNETTKRFAGDANEEIWNFRLERYFEGQQLPPIPVEMRGQQFVGHINEGDSIMLLTDWKGGLYKTKEVYSMTNNISIKSKQQGFFGRNTWMWPILIVLIIIIMFVIAAT